MTPGVLPVQPLLIDGGEPAPRDAVVRARVALDPFDGVLDPRAPRRIPPATRILNAGRPRTALRRPPRGLSRRILSP